MLPPPNTNWTRRRLQRRCAAGQFDGVGRTETRRTEGVTERTHELSLLRLAGVDEFDHDVRVR